MAEFLWTFFSSGTALDGGLIFVLGVHIRLFLGKWTWRLFSEPTVATNGIVLERQLLVNAIVRFLRNTRVGIVLFSSLDNVYGGDEVKFLGGLALLD